MTFGPNVIGKFTGWTVPSWYTEGAFSDIQVGSSAQGAAGNGYKYYQFDASRSNSIYTDSGVVRPLGLALNYIIRT